MAKVKIFSDFDGTISPIDIGNFIFSKFSENRNWESIKLWKENKISSKDLMIEECKMVRFTEAEALSSVKDFEIDSYFPGFYRYLESNNIPLTILSDGLSFYIDYFLRKYNLEEIPFVANVVNFQDGGKLKPEFPFYEEGCMSCGNCKGLHLRKARENGDKIVYIGDGYSDRCAAPEADIIFAKKDFAKYCIRENYKFYSFENFKDVLDILIKNDII